MNKTSRGHGRHLQGSMVRYRTVGSRLRHVFMFPQVFPDCLQVTLPLTFPSMEGTTHIGQRRLLNIAQDDLRLEESEVKHMQDCPPCLETFSKMILEVARSRARAKTAGQKTA